MVRFPAGRSFDVLGVGEISVDHLCVVPRVPGTSDKVRVSHYEVQGGGQIATAMVACTRLGLRARYLGTVGDDAWGEWSVDALTREGVDASGVHWAKGASTQLAFIMIDAASGERTVVWNRDDRTLSDPPRVGADAIAQARVLHVDATGLAGGLSMLRRAREAGTVTSIDIDHLIPETEQALKLIDVCILPEGFARELTGEQDLEGALRALRRFNPDAVVCVTLGAEGCIALDGEALVREPAFPVAAVDTTACGDVFRAGFLCAALLGQPLRGAMRFANAAAALKTRKLGGRPGIPTRAEVEALLASVRTPA